MNIMTASYQSAQGSRQDFTPQKIPVPPGSFEGRQQSVGQPANTHTHTSWQQGLIDAPEFPRKMANYRQSSGVPEAANSTPRYVEATNAVSSTSQQGLVEPSGGQNSSSEEKREVRYWTQEEHQRFVEGLSKYQKDGKPDLKAIAEYLGTRTPTQVRSHYQKYILKLKKSQESNSGNQDSV